VLSPCLLFFLEQPCLLFWRESDKVVSSKFDVKKWNAASDVERIE